MISSQWADTTLPEVEGKVHNLQAKYNTKDIVKRVLWADQWLRRNSLMMREFGSRVSPTYQGMQALYNLLYENIRYVEDGHQKQLVLSPSVLWESKEGDCKSFTVFIVGVLQQLGLEYIIRFTNYKRKHGKKAKHVYAIAILPSGEQVIIDPVWGLQGGGQFDTEKPYHYKKDYHMKPKTGLAFISGSGPDSNTVIEAIEDILNTIPESILDDGDLTAMTEGEAQRYFMATRLESVANNAATLPERNKLQFSAAVIRAGALSRVGALEEDQRGPVLRFLRKTSTLTAPAFVAPKLRISKSDQEAIDGFFRNVWNGIKKGAKAVAKVVVSPFKKAWQLLMNWIFKGPMQKAAPFFLFTYVKNKKGREVSRRAARQSSIKEFLIKLGVKRSTLDGSIRQGIVENLGNSPETILNRAAKGQIAGVGAVITSVIFKAVGWIIQVVKKVVKLFKKSEPEIRETDTSDLSVLEEEYAMQTTAEPSGYPGKKSSNKSGYPDGGSSNNSGNSAGGGLAIAASLAAALLAFS